MGEITIIYDNRTAREDLRSGWGFSALVDLSDIRFLFDTGADGETLLANMEKLAIDPHTISTVVLSHPHGDHTGGLSSLLGINPHLHIYLGRSFPRRFKQDVTRLGATVTEVSGPEHLFGPVYSTGELGRGIKEQSVVIADKAGVTVITGCAHPGVVAIAEAASRQMNRPIDLLLGGFHLGGTPEGKVREIIASLKELSVNRVGPGHCTGDRAIALFHEVYGDKFVPLGVGRKINI